MSSDASYVLIWSCSLCGAEEEGELRHHANGHPLYTASYASVELTFSVRREASGGLLRTHRCDGPMGPVGIMQITGTRLEKHVCKATFETALTHERVPCTQHRGKTHAGISSDGHVYEWGEAST